MERTKQNSWLYNANGEIRKFRAAMLIALMAIMVIGFVVFAYGYQIHSLVLAERPTEEYTIEISETGFGQINLYRYSADSEFKAFCVWNASPSLNWRSIEETQLILYEELGYMYWPIYREEDDRVTFFLLNGALNLPKNEEGLVTDVYVGLDYPSWCQTDCSMPEGVECTIPGGYLNHWDFRNALPFVDADGMSHISVQSIPILCELYLDGEFTVEKSSVDEKSLLTAQLSNGDKVVSSYGLWVFSNDEVTTSSVATNIYALSVYENYREIPLSERCFANMEIN